MNKSENLNAAADHIAVFGHHKGNALAEGYHSSVAPACIVGAVTVVNLASGTVQRDALNALNMYLGCGIISWNDAPERTAGEVVEALRACAIIEAAKESADVRESVPSCS
jgi:hypothetical protein